MKAIYKSIALLFGAMSMFSSCEDFLTRDPQDSFLLKDYLSSNEALANYTRQIYGPLTWNGFDDKFSWCVGEVYSGNVYHNYSDEGEFHFMKFTSTNAHIQNGYTSLYGVIAKCNHIINDVPAIAHDNGLSEEILNKVLGEAYMFRGMAYFYLAEYWGPCPIVLNNAHNISNNLVADVTRANRKSLYALIEKDWKKAFELLPGDRQPNNHAYKASAAGMLAKLYVTMASCQADIPEPESYKYRCPDVVGTYKEAVKWADECLKWVSNKDLAQDYDKMFWPNSDSPEILFALCFEQGVYAQGCSRQIQFARSMHLAGGGNAYGGEKGLTTLLFNSYEEGDKRLDGTAYYNKADKDWYNFSDTTWTKNSADDRQTLDNLKEGKGHSYILSDGSKYYYFLNPNKTLEEDERVYGNEPNSAIFNHCRKFIYAIKPKVSEFSIDLTIPLLRLADVYLLRAEANMGIAHTDVERETNAGLDDINKVRERAGLGKLTKECAFCKLNEPSRNSLKLSGEVNGKPIEVYYDKYYPAYNLMMERRHEFALENQAWLDIKRLYYRNPNMAKKYIEAQDRSYTFAQKDDNTAGQKSDFERVGLIYKLSVAQHEIDNSIKEQAPEGEIAIENLTFTLPVPSTIPQTGNFANIVDYSEQIENGSYPY